MNIFFVRKIFFVDIPNIYIATKFVWRIEYYPNGYRQIVVAKFNLMISHPPLCSREE